MKPKNVVHLVAKGDTGEIVEQLLLTVDDYYAGRSPILDSSEYRKTRGIRQLFGQIFGSKGQLLQEFSVNYDTQGRYSCSRAVHDDGTIIED